jgi:hypothetical protein
LNHPQQLNKSLKSLRQNAMMKLLKYYNSLDELNKDDIKKLKIIISAQQKSTKTPTTFLSR